MRCHNCSTRNPEGAEVCVRCATLLRRACPKCGFENPPEASLCAQCAATFTPRTAVPGKQRPAAARSAGIKEESTELKQDLNPEARALIAPALDLMKDAVLRYEIAALLAHRHEEAREIGAAVRWHQRAAEWAGIGGIRTALPHWQKVRELARQGADVPQTAALRVVACSKALAHGWRLGTSATDWAELFEEGCAAARRVGNLAALAALNANYGAVRGLNDGIASDYVRYASEAVRIADSTGNAALRCATRACLCFAHAWSGQLRQSERVADEVIDLARDDPYLGIDIVGFSPLLAVRLMRRRCIGYTREVETTLRKLPLLRQAALDNGYPEQGVWALSFGAEFEYALGSSGGTQTLAQAAVWLAQNLGVGNEILAALARCDALACDREWKSLLDAATETLQLIRVRGALRLAEPSFLAHLGTAQIELGNLEAGRAAAQEGVAFMRESKGAWSPRSYAVLARAQLELRAPVADIARTLDEYAELLERTEFRLFEGELHQLRARLANREGRHVERAAALKRAYDCHTSFGMGQQTTRMANPQTVR